LDSNDRNTLISDLENKANEIKKLTDEINLLQENEKQLKHESNFIQNKNF
jgi:hypothetical protein